MKVKRKIIEIDQDLCDGCGECVPSCAEGALEIVDGKARIIAEKYCDGLGACLGECPTGALSVVEREVDDFDEKAVEELLAAKERSEQQEKASECGCRSANIQTFLRPAPGPTASLQAPQISALSHWPIQIRLVPPTAPFLKNADLLVAADCTAAAYPRFQEDFLQGRAVMMGCPKFDDAEGYVRKFTEVFQQAELKSVTLLVMEVPCCSGMRMIINEAVKRAGVDLEINEAVVGVQGDILRQGEMAAAI